MNARNFIQLLAPVKGQKIKPHFIYRILAGVRMANDPRDPGADESIFGRIQWSRSSWMVAGEYTVYVFFKFS